MQNDILNRITSLEADVKTLRHLAQKDSSESLSEADIHSAVERSLHLQEGQELPVLKL